MGATKKQNAFALYLKSNVIKIRSAGGKRGSAIHMVASPLTQQSLDPAAIKCFAFLPTHLAQLQGGQPQQQHPVQPHQHHQPAPKDYLASLIIQ